MNILLDTHVLLWATSNSKNLSIKHKQIIADIDNIIFVSIATLWEPTIKQFLNFKLLTCDREILKYEEFFVTF